MLAPERPCLCSTYFGRTQLLRPVGTRIKCLELQSSIMSIKYKTAYLFINNKFIQARIVDNQRVASSYTCYFINNCILKDLKHNTGTHT